MSESDLGPHPSQIRRRVSENRNFSRFASIRPRHNLKRCLPSTFGKFSILEVKTSNASVRRADCVLEKEFSFLRVTQVRLIEHVALTVFHSLPISASVPDITAVFVLEVTAKEQGSIQGGIVKLVRCAARGWDFTDS